MTWVRLDDKFPRHRKVAALSDRAFRVYVMGLCLCAEDLTDGHISETNLRVIAARLAAKRIDRSVSELESAGMWERNRDGFHVANYLEYQPSSTSVLAKREADRKRKRDADS